MQPPPMRKGPYLKTLKHVHTEQVARLQAKNQHECDLLEDIRSFTKQRSAIEKSYADALLKISNAYLNKKIPSIPDLRDEDGDEQWNVWNVWRTVLEENEKLAKARLAAVEVFQQQITDDAKTIRQIKLSACKKHLDQLQVVQKEVQYSVAELDRNKKFYFEEEHLAHDVRDKARDVEEKLKKKKGSIFSSLTSLKRESVKRVGKGKEDLLQKVSSKKEVCEEKSTGARNEYLLALAIANAHQDRYYNVDLDDCLRNLEAEVYARLKEYLTVLSRTELLTCSAAQNSFSKIRDQAQMLSREYNVMCCVQYYPVLKQHIRYPFEPCDGDSCTKITCDHGARSILSCEAKKWAAKIGKEAKTAKESQKKLNYLVQLKEAGNKTDPDDPSGPDLDTRIDELREIIRKAETEKCKAEGVIECLRDGDVNVDEFMQDIENLTTTFETMPRSSSITSIKTDDSREQRPQTDTYYDSDNDTGSEIVPEQETAVIEPVERDEDIEAQIETERKKIEALSAMTWDDPINVDWGESTQEEPAEEPVTSPPPDSKQQSQQNDNWQGEAGGEPTGVRCVAIYTYTAANPDELSILENEHLELIGEGDESGWVRAKNYKGEEGYVPQNYVEIEGNSVTSSGFPLQPQISFSSVDYHVQEKSPFGETSDEVIADETEAPKTNGIANGYLDQNEDENQNLPQQEGTPTVPTSVSSGLTTPFINEYRHGDGGGDFCRALYDYEATNPEELSFYESQIIKILRRDDDGWWEGEYDGITGVFPEIVVEECRWDGEPLSPMGEDDEEDDEEMSDSGIMPPCYTPPEVPAHLLPPETIVVTQPTPEVEHAITNKDSEDSIEPPTIVENNNDPSAFEMELSGDKQQQYQAHFTDNNEPQIIIISDTPDITVTMEPDDIDASEDNQDSGMGLEVAQIVITAATPMAEAPAVTFPEVEKEDIADSPEEEDKEPVKSAEVPPVVSVESPIDDDFDDSIFDVPQSHEHKFEKVKFKIDEPQCKEAESQDDTGWAAFSEDLPREPISSIPRVVEVEVKEHVASTIEPKKASLEIDDKAGKMSLGESNESPVTPEELDVQNLAKLESLKESDA